MNNVIDTGGSRGIGPDIVRCFSQNRLQGDGSERPKQFFRRDYSKPREGPAMSPQYLVCAYVNGFQHLSYAVSLVFAGLCGLAEEGFIRLSFVSPRDRLARYRAEGTIQCLEVIHVATNKNKLICIDTRDRADDVCLDLLERCDIYFKRSFLPSELAALGLSERLVAKVVPFGLMFACRGRANTTRLLKQFAINLGHDFLHNPAKAFSGIRRGGHIVKEFFSLPLIEEFEQGPEEKVDQNVFFQSRVWEPADTTDDAEQVNEVRVALVRELRKAFGTRFSGGIVPTQYARERYPDVLTNLSSGRSGYISQSKKCLIGIYCRGLHHSAAYKLPEYLAASKCIVSEPLRNILPTALEEGRNWLLFKHPRECVEQCSILLSNGERARMMRNENHRYYVGEVSPVARMGKCLEASFAKMR